MAKDLIRMMHALFLPEQRDVRGESWAPPADIYRTRAGWLVKLDLAGVRPEDVQLEARGSRLTVRGTRRDCVTEEGCHYYRMEISYSHFERDLELPCPVEEARIATEYRDGMLLVHITPEAT